MDVVSNVLVERRAVAAGIDRMLGWSTVAHVALLAFVALLPTGWLGARPDEPENVMSIDLAGTIGPRTGGMTAISARPVQAVKAEDTPKTVEPNRPPAAAEPEMIEPVKTLPKKQEAPVKTKIPDAKSRTPTKGAEITKGQAVADTKSRNTSWGGLTTGGGGTGAQLDVGDFCCPEYIVTMQELINRNWSQKQNMDATTVMRFTIQRDGTLTDIALFKSSGNGTLDLVSQRALILTKQLPPLPVAYTQSSLTVRLTFEFLR